MWRRSCSRALATSKPATSARPALGLVSVQSMLIVVVLPAPLGPRKPKTSPVSTSKFVPLTASKSPNDLRRSLTEIAGVDMGGGERFVGPSPEAPGGAPGCTPYGKYTVRTMSVTPAERSGEGQRSFRRAE